MKSRLKILFILSFLSFFQGIKAQNTFRKVVMPYRDTIYIQDSLTIIPSSIIAFDDNKAKVEQFSFKNNHKNNYIFFPIPKKGIKTLHIHYRVLPYNLTSTFTHIDSGLVRSQQKDNWLWQPLKESKKNGLPDQKGLNYAGTFSRNIAVGNNQDLVVQSNFNLQMTGKLSQDVEINAAITDNNIPIQPDGNTANLNQFDRIFINLKRKNTQLNAGDFDFMKPQNTYFMNFQKRAQGLAVLHEEKFKRGQSLNLKAAAAVSRGKFARQNISPIEGNQGPYRLQGADGERFIIVIAGTEKIYIDGNLQKRGFDNDYMIDYNQGIVTFTAKTFVKREHRIIAEFEYNDQSYVRTMYATSVEHRVKNNLIYFHLYGEQDSRGSSTQNLLRESDKARFGEAGDALNGVLVGGVDTIAVFENDRILYASRTDNQNNEYFYFSKNQDSAKYSLRFVEVPAGDGDYNIRLSDANGRVYEYVGKGKGNFSIGSKLTPPKLLQLYTLGSELQLWKKKNGTLRTEIAMSNRDENRFSVIGDNDNIGIGFFSTYSQQNKWGKKWSSATQIGIEQVQQNFRALNPYRPVEFVRDWNVTAQPNRFSEQIWKAQWAVRRDSLGTLAYEFNQFRQVGNYSGQKHFTQLEIARKGWQWQTSLNYLHTDSEIEKSFFSRPKMEIKKVFKQKNALGLYVEREKNERQVSDTLAKNSFYYDLLKAYWQSSAKKKWTTNVAFQMRKDFFPIKNRFEMSILAREITSNVTYANKQNFTLGGNFIFRDLDVQLPLATTQKSQQTYLGHIDATWSKWKNALVSQTGYEIGSGQEQKIEYFYQQVDPGRGNFTWRDANKDKIIQQNEVFNVVFQDSANVIRFIVPSNQFIQTNNLSVNQVLNLNPKAFWGKDTIIWKRVLSKFATENAFQLQRKTKVGSDAPIWNPFMNIGITDTSLVTYLTTFRNVLFFNRGNNRFELQAGSSQNSNRSILTTGYDIKQQNEQYLRLRWNLSQSITFKTTFTNLNRYNESEFFRERNYDIFTKIVEPEINWQPNNDFRIKTTYKYSNNIDSLEQKETALIHDFNTEITFNKGSKTSIRGRASFVNINYIGARNSPVQYAMLNGLQNGKNYLWGLQINQALNKTLQLEMRYEGRKTGEVRIVHTGNMALRALF
jgi:hypothetical protein